MYIVEIYFGECRQFLDDLVSETPNRGALHWILLGYYSPQPHDTALFQTLHPAILILTVPDIESSIKCVIRQQSESDNERRERTDRQTDRQTRTIN